MKASFSIVLISAAAYLPFIKGQSNVGSNLSINSTLEITNANVAFDEATSAASISGTSLHRDCALLTAQEGVWALANGTGDSVKFGGFEPKGTTTAANFQTFGIPDGALIDIVLDVSAGHKIDHHVFYTVDYSSLCIAEYTCSGNTVFKYSYKLDGIVCSPPSNTSSVPPPTSTPTNTPGVAPKFGQCGGLGWTGPTVCVAGTVCTVLNAFFSQCV